MTQKTLKTVMNELVLNLNEYTIDLDTLKQDYDNQKDPIQRNFLAEAIIRKRRYALPVMEAFYECMALSKELGIEPKTGHEYYMVDWGFDELEGSQKLIEGFYGNAYPFHPFEKFRHTSRAVFIGELQSYHTI